MASQIPNAKLTNDPVSSTVRNTPMSSNEKRMMIMLGIGALCLIGIGGAVFAFSFIGHKKFQNIDNQLNLITSQISNQQESKITKKQNHAPYFPYPQFPTCNQPMHLTHPKQKEQEENHKQQFDQVSSFQKMAGYLFPSNTLIISDTADDISINDLTNHSSDHDIKEVSELNPEMTHIIENSADGEKFLNNDTDETTNVSSTPEKEPKPENQEINQNDECTKFITENSKM